MNISLLTYNLLFNKAFDWLGKLLVKYQPDVICLQEVDTNEANLLKLNKFGFKLADYSNSFIQFGKIYGIATYYNPKKLKLVDTNSFNLPKSFYEAFTSFIKILKAGSQPRTILKTDFASVKGNKQITIYNIHLSVYGINRTRTKQLETILNHKTIKTRLPFIITGDFNYFPYRRKNLERIMSKHGLREATSSINYTIRFPDRKFARYSFFQELAAKFVRKYFNNKVKADYTFYKNLKLTKTERIEEKFSDHYPILCNFKIP